MRGDLVGEDPTVRLDDEEPPVPRVRDRHRPRQARDHLLEGDAPGRVERRCVARPLRSRGDGSTELPGPVTAPGGGVADRAPGPLVQMVERGSAAVGGEGAERSGEPARRVPLHRGQPDLVDPPVVGGIGGGIGVVLLGADDEVGVPLVACHEVVLVAHVLVRADVAVSLGIEDAVDVDPQPAGRLLPRHGDVVPGAVRHARRPADRVPRRAGAHAEGDPTSRERHAEVAVGAGTVDVPVEEDVAEDPAVVGVAVDTRGGVVAVLGPHPPLQGEVGRPDVSRLGGVVDPDRDAVDAALAVAEEPERRGGRRSREQETEPDHQQESEA